MLSDEEVAEFIAKESCGLVTWGDADVAEVVLFLLKRCVEGDGS